VEEFEKKWGLTSSDSGLYLYSLCEWWYTSTVCVNDGIQVQSVWMMVYKYSNCVNDGTCILQTVWLHCTSPTEYSIPLNGCLCALYTWAKFGQFINDKAGPSVDVGSEVVYFNLHTAGLPIKEPCSGFGGGTNLLVIGSSLSILVSWCFAPAFRVLPFSTPLPISYAVCKRNTYNYCTLQGNDFVQN
jgi:hypothetical protein